MKANLTGTKSELTKIDDCKGKIVAATEKHIMWESGVELVKGDKVRLPKVAGGGVGTVDVIELIWGPHDEITLSVRVVDSKGKGHRFEYEEET